MRPRNRSENGFTMAEVMITVFVVSVLCAIAIPAYTRNVRHARKSEAVTQLRKIYEAARVFAAADSAVPRTGAYSFPPSQALTPAASCCNYPGGRCPVDSEAWATTAWQMLSFSMTDPHYFRYGFESSISGRTARFTATAAGDLDCDGVDETMEMVGDVEGVYQLVSSN
jgi:prepilin-type N-terminal cleavage/methylation domain-containing protein